MNEKTIISTLDRKFGSERSASLEVHQWHHPAPMIDPNRILRVHRYKDPDAVRPVIRETAQAMADRAATVASPEARWRRVPITDLESGVLTLQGGAILHCDAFDRLLADAIEALIFVLTLGADFDAEVVKLIDDFEPLEALFMEAAGWLMIERMTQRFSGHLRRELGESGINLGYRMGPGYSYRDSSSDEEERSVWPLEQQQVVFSLFGDEPLPVELLISSAMKPKMSRSGLYGLHAPRPR